VPQIKESWDGFKWWVREGFRHDEITLTKEVLGLLAAYHWFWKMFFNVKEGKAWYHGLPHTWWYGMGVLDVVENLPEHVLEEPEWLDLIKND